jgi:hypothetical protein
MSNRFFIAPYDANSGLRTDVKPWLIPDEAFSLMKNAYVFRGRVRKRFGTRYTNNQSNPTLSQLRHLLVGVFGGANTVVTTPSNLVVGQTFSVNNVLYTITTITPPGFGDVLLKSNPAAPNAQVSAANTVTFLGIDFSATPIYWYPHLPVMGFVSKEQDLLNQEETVAFDTRYAYRYAAGWLRLAGGADTWSSTDANFFWGVNYLAPQTGIRYLFITNFDLTVPVSATNNMRYYDGAVWNAFQPRINATATVTMKTARILTVFHNRLLALNVQEYDSTGPTATIYPNRCRFSALGDATNALAFREDLAGQGGFVDAYTTEAIVTVEFVKDRLIVYFERSTWELAYTGNEITPFTWQQLNTELGAESTFSIIPFDRVAIGVGQVGVHACNGSNVERIDQKIPEQIFQIRDAGVATARVYGIRDYFVEMLYWTYPDQNTNDDLNPYPKKILVYNYVNNTWSINDDSITAFGYFQPSQGVNWAMNTPWASDTPWVTGSGQSQFRQVIGGNQQGYTFICDSNSTNTAQVITITNITAIVAPTGEVTRTLTVYNHNFDVGEYIYINDCTGDTQINSKIFEITNVINQNSFEIISLDAFVAYTGGGKIARVPEIVISTKEYNFYGEKGHNTALNKVDFLVDTTPAGRIDINYYASTNVQNLLNASAASGALLGTGTLETFAQPNSFEQSTSRVWHPVYFMGEGEVVQLQFAFNDEQLRSTDIWSSDFQLHAMVLYTQPTSSRYQ